MIGELCGKCFTEVARDVAETLTQGNVTTQVIDVRCPCCGKRYTDYDVSFQASDILARQAREQKARRASRNRQRGPKVYFRRIVTGGQARP